MSYAGAVAALLTVASLAGSAGSVPVVPPMPSGTVKPAAAPAGSTTTTWSWPLDPRPAVARPFAPPDQRWLPGHRGVDLIAPGPGVPVRAPTDGRVRFRGLVAGKEVLVVEHDGGLRSTFEPVTSQLPLGSLVTRGETVGVLGTTPGHCAPLACLHWGVVRGETYLDPLAFIRRAPVRLLPLP